MALRSGSAAITCSVPLCSMNVILGMPSPHAMRPVRPQRLHDPIRYWYTVPLCELAAQLGLADLATRRTGQVAENHELFGYLLLRAAGCSEVRNDRVERE